MTCRWTCDRSTVRRDQRELSLRGSETGVVYLDLAAAGRKEDFVWFARSQGVSPDRIEALWEAALARVEHEIAIAR